VAVSEHKGNLVFLRRILPGGANRSYGIQVARLAGIPIDVVNRAWDILNELENTDLLKGEMIPSGTPNLPDLQTQLPLLPLMTFPTVVKELLDLDVTSMTPLQAINKLYQIQEDARKEYSETNNNEMI
jgi:DNA mismatch repair protein MutS